MPRDFGLNNVKEDVLRFWRRWRLSEYLLTITGSYEQDEARYSDFWRDVLLCEGIYRNSETEVENTLRVVRSG